MEVKPISTSSAFLNIPHFRQILAASAVILLASIGAMTSGLTTILIEQLDEIKGLSTESKSWLASAPILPMALGCLVGGWLKEFRGRLMALMITCVLTSTGWLLMYLSPNIPCLISARAITGFCVGLSSPAPVTFLGEISYPKYRGIFLSGTVVGVASGFLISHVFGYFMNWRCSSVVIALLPVPCFYIFFILPESHTWLLRNDSIEAAVRSFRYYRGYDDNSTNELNRILDSRREESGSLTCYETVKACLNLKFLKSLLTLSLYFMTLQFSGNNVIIFYTVDIMRKTIYGIDEYSATLIVDVCRVISCAVGCCISKHIGLRTLTKISGIGAGTSLLFLSLTDFLGSSSTPFPLFSLISFMAFLYLGLRIIPWILCGEIFAPDTKGIGGGISTCINFISFFIVVKISPAYLEWGMGLFGIYAVIVYVGTILLLFLIPETRGVTLEDIQDTL